MNEMSQRFKMGYGANLNRIRYNNNITSLPLRTLNSININSKNNEINKYIQKRLIQQRAYKIYKMKLQKGIEKEKEKEVEEEKDSEIIFSKIYKNEENPITDYIKSKHFKDYDIDRENVETELIQEESDEAEDEEELIDTDTDSD